jgi:phage N-6-adenine-methyltransferase
MTNEMGHNERTSRLGLLAEDAQRGLARVADGEADTIEGWLAYGAALNEGRALFPSNNEFHEWMVSHQLGGTHDNERAAAMWAAANPDDFKAAQEAGNARTVRGIYAKWQEMDAARKLAEQKARMEEERKRADEARARATEMRRQAEKQREEAEARAKAEKQARLAAKAAKDAEERKAAQQLARQQAEQRAEAMRAQREAQEQMRAATAQAKASDKAVKTAQREADASQKRIEKSEAQKAVHVSQNSGENEWYTPPQYIEAARRAMGGIDLDPATSEIANRTVQAAQYFTDQDDGLAHQWPVGRIWMNPPYAQPLIGQFSEKLAQAVEAGSEAIVLVNNATETAWFQRMVSAATAICFPKSRIRFLDPEGNPGAPLQGQAFIYCGNRPEAFAVEFSQFGFLVEVRR